MFDSGVPVVMPVRAMQECQLHTFGSCAALVDQFYRFEEEIPQFKALVRNLLIMRSLDLREYILGMVPVLCCPMVLYTSIFFLVGARNMKISFTTHEMYLSNACSLHRSR